MQEADLIFPVMDFSIHLFSSLPAAHGHVSSEAIYLITSQGNSSPTRKSLFGPSEPRKRAALGLLSHQVSTGGASDWQFQVSQGNPPKGHSYPPTTTSRWLSPRVDLGTRQQSPELPESFSPNRPSNCYLLLTHPCNSIFTVVIIFSSAVVTYPLQVHRSR